MELEKKASAGLKFSIDTSQFTSKGRSRVEQSREIPLKSILKKSERSAIDREKTL